MAQRLHALRNHSDTKPLKIQNSLSGILGLIGLTAEPAVTNSVTAGQQKAYLAQFSGQQWVITTDHLAALDSTKACRSLLILQSLCCYGR
jgi:hypothetical protein